MIECPVEEAVKRHLWKATGKTGTHAGKRTVVYLKCLMCGQIGFKYPESKVVYTWHQEYRYPEVCA